VGFDIRQTGRAIMLPAGEGSGWHRATSRNGQPCPHIIVGSQVGSGHGLSAFWRADPGDHGNSSCR
jgi:hypothetical protein